MSGFEIVNNISEINLNNEWIDSINFKSRNKIVGDKGKKVSAGHHYQLIAKKERSFSRLERLGRGFLGTLIVVCSLCCALFFKSLRNLFIKNHESIHFGVIIDPFSQCLSFSEEKRLDPNPAISLSTEINLKIFSYFNYADLTNCSQVSKTWQVLANDDGLRNALPVPIIAFGKKQWNLHFGDIGKEPRLPKNIHKILNSSCPFWSKKKVEETHWLFLIPETINGEPLTLKVLGKLVKNPKEGYATQYRLFGLGDLICDRYDLPIVNQSTIKSHWVLMTKDIIPHSRNKLYTDQKALITTKQRGYEDPNVLDAVICIFMKYVSSKERLFNAINDIGTMTRCKEQMDDLDQGPHRVAVGGFCSDGLLVVANRVFGSSELSDKWVGMAALLRLSTAV